MNILITMFFTILPLLFQTQEIELPTYISDGLWIQRDNIESITFDGYINSGYYCFAVDKDNTLLKTYGFKSVEHKDYYEYPITSHEDYLFLHLEDKLKVTNELTRDFNDICSISNYNVKYLGGLLTRVETGFFARPIEPIITTKPFMYNKIDKITYNLTDTKSVEYIVNSLQVYDSIDKEISLDKIEIYLDEYSENREIPGVYKVSIRVKNSRDKYMFHTITITISNNTLPTLLVPYNFIISTSIEMDMSYITNTIIAKDYSGYDLEVDIFYDNYMLNRLEGLYTIQFSTTDQYNQTIYSSTTINVIKSDLEFFTYDNVNVVINEYKDLTNEELISLLYLVKDDYYNNEILVNNQINIELGYSYVFFDIVDLDIEERLHITFNNIEIITIDEHEENKINLQIIFIILLSVTVVTCSSIIIYEKITKKY